MNKSLLWMVIVILVGVVAYYALNAPDQRNGVQKVGDAISELPNGPDKAARELKDRTPADKIDDSLKDAGDKLKAPDKQ